MDPVVEDRHPRHRGAIVRVGKKEVPGGLPVGGHLADHDGVVHIRDDSESRLGRDDVEGRSDGGTPLHLIGDLVGTGRQVVFGNQVQVAGTIRQHEFAVLVPAGIHRVIDGGIPHLNRAQTNLVDGQGDPGPGRGDGQQLPYPPHRPVGSALTIGEHGPADQARIGLGPVPHIGLYSGEPTHPSGQTG